jgi:photosystem II stability/assembly factor-like uncharacterized protein
LLVFGMRGHAFLSHDSGRSWQASEVPQNLSLFGGAALANGDIVLVGASNAVLVSRDGGRRFTSVSPRARDSLAAVLPLPSGEVLTGGEGGIHLRGLKPGPTGEAP